MKNWIETSFESILVSFESGKRPKGGVKVFRNGIPSLGAEHLNSKGSFNFDKIKFVPDNFAKDMSKGHIKNKDLLIVKDGATTGKVAFVSESFPYKIAVINEHLFRCHVFEKINPKYIFYFLFSNTGQNRILRNFKGTAQGGINTTFALNTLIPIAPRNEQNRIVEKIEELFSGLDKVTEELLKVQEQLKVYRQAVLKAAFDGKLIDNESYDYLPFSKTCDINPPKKEISNTNGDLEVTFLPMSLLSTSGTMLKGEVRKLKKVIKGYTYFRNGDVLLAKITPCFENGKRAIARELKNGIGFGSTEFHVLRPSDKVISEWVFYGISFEDFRNKAKSQMTGTAGQRRVPKRVIEDYKIPVPEKIIQKKIVQEIESRLSLCDKIEESVESGLKKIEHLRQSILKKAFEGKLVPQWTDLPAPQPGKYWVYVVKCNNDSNYIGFTSNLRKRWEQHLNGDGADWTKRYKPKYIMYWEEFDNQEDAVFREKQLKTGYGRKWIKREEEKGRLWRAGETAEELLKQIKIEKEKTKNNSKKKVKA